VSRPAPRQMSFADLKLLRQGVRLEPLLQAICDFLDKWPAPVERVRRDLVRGLKQPDRGRRGLAAPQVLRALVLMLVKNWDYRESRERIADGMTLRAFTNFHCEEVRKLRLDTTVVETDIHHPTDNTLLWDVVRALTRLLGRLAKGVAAHRAFSQWLACCAPAQYEIQRMTTRQHHGAGSQQTATYRALIEIAEEVVPNARMALDDTAALAGKDPLTALNIKTLREEIAHYWRARRQPGAAPRARRPTLSDSAICPYNRSR
jgi:IS5 family transposase